MTETQSTIGAWAWQIFGRSAPGKLVAHANQAMAGLVSMAAGGASTAAIAEQTAAVAILLVQLAHEAGFDLENAIDRKMKINRDQVA